MKCAEARRRNSQSSHLDLMRTLLLLFGCTFAAMAAPSLELRDGDRVVFLGDGFTEREQYEGWVELAATTRFADRAVTFRNLGWSGDLPDGRSRSGLSLLQAGMEPAGEGWRQLQAQLSTYQPSVVFTGYGMAAALPGGPTPQEFRADFVRLLDELSAARVVVLGVPPRFPRQGESSAELAAARTAVAQIDAVLREVAAQRQLPYIALQGLAEKEGLSENGIHLNGAGYQAVAREIEQQLGWGRGRWDQGETAAALREAILKKNAWFFHRSRPANMAYIFGFRKAEQGRNAGEILAFDQLVAQEEQRIAAMRALRQTVPQIPVRTESTVAARATQPLPKFRVADGYEIELWAENPLLHKPTQINFDSRGRLWVASAETYPQVEVGQTPNDKVWILEDRDGDGRAETSTPFADGLLMPTGLLPDGDGCYVAQSTDLLYFRDTDGDGRADERRRVLSGFGTEDTHHNLHTLRRGPDGKLWMNQSIYTRSDAETPHGVMRLKSGGIMRFDPRADRLEPVYLGWCNPWGHEVDRYGQSFVTDGAGGGGIHWGIPGAMYFTYAHAPKVLEGISPGAYPKFCGLEILESPHFPAEWQGSMITCDFRAHRIVRFAIHDAGSGYVAQEAGDLLRTTEVNFRPIDVKIGPDGALYIADWANPIINHGEVDFRDPRRDREHGRIWRLRRKGAPLTERLDLTQQSVSACVTMLSSDHRQRREAALAELQRRSPDEQRQALEVSRARATGGLELLTAVQLSVALGARDPMLVDRALVDDRPEVRAAAARLVADEGGQLGKAAQLERLAIAAKDDHGRVRVEAVRGLAKVGGTEALDASLRALNGTRDRFLDYALWLSVASEGQAWLNELVAGARPLDGREAALEFVLENLPAGQGRAEIRRLMPPSLPRDGAGPWLELALKSGDPILLEKLYDQALRAGFEDEVMVTVLAALEAAVRERGLRLMLRQAQLGSLLQSDREAVAAAAMRLAGALEADGLFPALVATASEPAWSSRSDAAVDALSGYRSDAAREALAAVASGGAEPLRRVRAALALARHHRATAVREMIALLPALKEESARTFWQQALSARGLAADLAVALRASPLESAVAAAQVAAIPVIDEHRELLDELRRQGGLSLAGPDAARVQELATAALELGDPARGELIYRRASMACIACHAIGGAGGKLGPDMTSIGASAPADYLVESVLIPAAKVKEGYHAVILETRDGRTVMGRVLKSGGGQIVVADAAGQEIALAEEAIVSRTDTGSLMPAQLIDALTHQEQLDLFNFLSQLGRPGDYDATKSRAPRAWAVLALTGEPTPEAQAGAESLAWTPHIGTVNGRLLAAELEPTLNGATEALAAARFQLGSAGPVVITLPDCVSEAWVDGQRIGKSELELEAGLHTVVVRFRTGTDLRIEASAGTFLPQW